MWVLQHTAVCWGAPRLDTVWDCWLHVEPATCCAVEKASGCISRSETEAANALNPGHQMPVYTPALWQVQQGACAEF